MVLWRKRPPLHVSVWDGVAYSLWSCGKTALHSKKNNFEGSCPVVLWRKRTPVEDLHVSMYQCGNVCLQLRKQDIMVLWSLVKNMTSMFLQNWNSSGRLSLQSSLLKAYVAIQER